LRDEVSWQVVVELTPVHGARFYVDGRSA
jgi:hypothetical protein